MTGQHSKDWVNWREKPRETRVIAGPVAAMPHNPGNFGEASGQAAVRAPVAPFHPHRLRWLDPGSRPIRADLASHAAWDLIRGQAALLARDGNAHRRKAGATMELMWDQVRAAPQRHAALRRSSSSRCQISTRASVSSTIIAGVCCGPGVKRRRSVPRGTVGKLIGCT